MTKRYNILPMLGAGVGTFVDPGVQYGIDTQDLKLVAKGAGRAWSGYNYNNNKWELKRATGIIGLVLGAVGSKAASKTGLNRYLPKGINL